MAKELKTLKALLKAKEEGKFTGKIVIDNDEVLAVQGDDVFARLDGPDQLIFEALKLLGFEKVARC